MDYPRTPDTDIENHMVLGNDTQPTSGDPDQRYQELYDEALSDLNEALEVIGPSKPKELSEFIADELFDNIVFEAEGYGEHGLAKRYNEKNLVAAYAKWRDSVATRYAEHMTGQS